MDCARGTHYSDTQVIGISIELEQVGFDYGTQPMLFEARIEGGSFTALIGPSGGGKTTFLQLIAGFEDPDNGIVRLGGRDFTRSPPWERPVFTVFQEHNLFAHLDVVTNVALGSSPHRRHWNRQHIASALERVGLGGYGQRQPSQLSGGERQRVALARALICQKPVLLLDEPFVSLDPALRQDMLDLLSSLHREFRMTVVLVTHQPQEARQAATHTGFISDGCVVALCESEILFAREQLKSYLGDSIE